MSPNQSLAPTCQEVEDVDIGVYTRPEVLAHKLEARHERNTEQAWNLSRLPLRISTDGRHRLFVATEGFWRGYFVLAKDILLTPDMRACTLLFDTRTWRRIPPIPRPHFRGFTYGVPQLDATGAVLSSIPPATRPRAHPSLENGDHRH